MIRKATIVTLTLASLATAGAWTLSYSEWPGNWRFDAPTLRLHGGHQPWTQSYQEWWLLHKTETGYNQVGLVNGKLSVSTRYVTPSSEAPLDRSYDWSGFSYRVKTSWYGFTNSDVDVRLTLRLNALLFVFVAYPTIAFIRGPLRRWRRRRKGLCVKCGYNLTGLPEPRCPECGAAI